MPTVDFAYVIEIPAPRKECFTFPMRKNRDGTTLGERSGFQPKAKSAKVAGVTRVPGVPASHPHGINKSLLVQLLNDPRLAHDPQTVTALLNLVQQRSGLTFISSRSDSARTFLITAMGNSARLKIRACGLDAHKPEAFVPVNGVLYLSKPSSPAELAAILRDVWQSIADSEAQLLLFNGIWSTGPDARSKTAEMARDRNVLVADNFGDAIPELRDWPGVNSSLIFVDWAEREGGRLRVSIQSHSQNRTWKGDHDKLGHFPKN